MSLNGTSISGVTISGATIAGATISGATITGATISGAHISGAKIDGATFNGDTVSGGTISGGTVAGGTIHGGTVSGGTIAGGTISGGTIAAMKPEESPPPDPKAQPPPPRQGQPAASQPSAKPPPDRGQGGASAEHDNKSKQQQPEKRTTAANQEDDEEVAARALQHLLVQRGALLLPIWGLEITPGLGYSHTTRDSFILVPGATQASPPTSLPVRRRTNQVAGTLGARLGIPWDLQVEASMPAIVGWNNAVVAGASSTDQSAFGAGDPRFTVTWQALHAGSLAPDVFLAGFVKPRIGSSPFNAGPADLPLGSGYPSVGGTITGVKTADPLVLLASATYTANLHVNTSQGRHNPGDTYGLGGGAILAVSPETSMQFLVDFHYKREDTLKNKPLAGTDEIGAVLQLGLGTVLSRNTLLNVSLGIGLTADSPDFQLGVSVPIRFY
ncbi:MAG: pentapeptide repeat-containing protein [Myxococcales bacterium]